MVSTLTIFILDASTARTGSLVCAISIAKAINNIEDVVLVVPNNAQLNNEDRQQFTRIVHLPLAVLNKSLKSICLYGIRLLVSSWKLRGILYRSQNNILIVNDFYLMEGAVVRAFGFTGHIYTWIRIDPSRYGFIGKIWMAFARWSSTRMVVVSKFIRNIVRYEDANVLYDSVSEKFLQLKQPSLVENLHFVYIGNYITGKGQDIALSAFSKLVIKWPESSLSFYGGTMNLSKNLIYKNDLKEQARSLGIEKSVLFNDFATDPASALSGKFAALNLSNSESFSMTVLEAAAAGLPVISTRSGGPQEIINDGIEGLLIPIADVSACEAAMSLLCSNRELARKMGQAGRLRVKEHFSNEAFRGRLMNLLALDEVSLKNTKYKKFK